jgi:hypothetical protein
MTQYKSKFVKIMPPWGWSHNRGYCFNMCSYEENILIKSFPQEALCRKAEIYMMYFSHSTKARFLKSWSLGVRWGHNGENCF